MSFAVTCSACGKKLQVPEELAGKRARCSSCGEVVSVPAAEAAPPARRERQSASSQKPAREYEPPVPAPPRIPTLRKRKKPPSRARYTFFGVERSVLGWLAVLVVGGGLIAAAVYFGSSLLPGGPPRVAEVRLVDVFTVFKVRQRNPLRDNWAGDERFKLAGSKRILVLRDNPEGRFLLVRCTVSQKVLEKQGRVRSGTVSLNSHDIRLQGDSATGECVLLVEDFANEGVAVRLLGSKDPAEARIGGDPDWTHDGKQTTTLELRPLSKDDDLIVASGKAEFRAPSGMAVQAEYSRLTALVTWDAGSRGWLGDSHFEMLEQMLDRVEVICLFPRLAGGGKGLSLEVLGQTVPLKSR